MHPLILEPPLVTSSSTSTRPGNRTRPPKFSLQSPWIRWRASLLITARRAFETDLKSIGNHIRQDFSSPTPSARCYPASSDSLQRGPGETHMRGVEESKDGSRATHRGISFPTCTWRHSRIRISLGRPTGERHPQPPQAPPGRGRGGRANFWACEVSGAFFGHPP